jgi:hypothetical protein
MDVRIRLLIVYSYGLAQPSALGLAAPLPLAVKPNAVEALAPRAPLYAPGLPDGRIVSGDGRGCPRSLDAP